MREQVVDHVIHPQVGKAQRGVIVVQLERCDPGRIGLKAEHEEVRHEPHVFADVLRNAVGRTDHVGLVESRAPALEFAFLPGVFDALLHVAHGMQIFVEFVLVRIAEPTAQTARIVEHRVEDAAVAPLHLVLEKPVKREGRINFQRRRGSRRTPRDVRAVEHRIILVHRRVGFLAAEHEARHLGRVPVALRQQLVDTRARADLAARGERRARKQISSLGTVDVPLQRLLVVETANEKHLFPMSRERGQHLPQLHLVARSFCPPFLAVKSVAGKHHGQAHRRFARGVAAARFITPDVERFHPGERHGDSDSP